MNKHLAPAGNSVRLAGGSTNLALLDRVRIEQGAAVLPLAEG